MNCIWILLLLCLCNGSEQRSSMGCMRNNRENGCACSSMRKSTCNNDIEERSENRREEKCNERRFPMPPFAPEAGCCHEASDTSDSADSEEMLR